MGRAKVDLEDPELTLDELKALQALYQPDLLVEEILKSQRYIQMMNKATMPEDLPGNNYNNGERREELNGREKITPLF